MRYYCKIVSINNYYLGGIVTSKVKGLPFRMPDSKEMKPVDYNVFFEYTKKPSVLSDEEMEKLLSCSTVEFKLRDGFSEEDYSLFKYYTSIKSELSMDDFNIIDKWRKDIINFTPSDVDYFNRTRKAEIIVTIQNTDNGTESKYCLTGVMVWGIEAHPTYEKDEFTQSAHIEYKIDHSHNLQLV